MAARLSVRVTAVQLPTPLHCYLTLQHGGEETRTEVAPVSDAPAFKRSVHTFSVSEDAREAASEPVHLAAYVVREGGAVGQQGVGHLLGSAPLPLRALAGQLAAGASLPLYAALLAEDGGTPAARVALAVQFTRPNLEGALPPPEVPPTPPPVPREVPLDGPFAAPTAPSAAALALLAAGDVAPGALSARATLALAPHQASPAWWQAQALADVSATLLAARHATGDGALPWASLAAPPTLLSPPNLASALVRALMKKTKRAVSLVRSPLPALGDWGDTAQTGAAGGAAASQSGFSVDHAWLRVGLRRAALGAGAAGAAFRVSLTLEGSAGEEAGGAATTAAGVADEGGVATWNTALLLRLPSAGGAMAVRVALAPVPLAGQSAPAPLTASLPLAALPPCATASTCLRWREAGVALWLTAHHTPPVQGVWESESGRPPAELPPVPARLLVLPRALRGGLPPALAATGDASARVRAAEDADLTVVCTPVPPPLLRAAAGAVGAPPASAATPDWPGAGAESVAGVQAHAQAAIGALAASFPATQGDVGEDGSVAFACDHGGRLEGVPTAVWAPPAHAAAPGPAGDGGAFQAWWAAARGGVLAPQPGLLPAGVLDPTHSPLLGGFGEWAAAPAPEGTEGAPGSAALPRVLWGDAPGAGMAGWGVLVSLFARPQPGTLLPTACVGASLAVLTRGRSEGQAAATSAAEAAAQDAEASATTVAALALPPPLHPAVLPLRAPAVGAGAAGGTRSDTMAAVKSAGAYPGLLGGGSEHVPVFAPGGAPGAPSDAMALSVFSWPGWGGGAADGSAPVPAPTKQTLRRERGLASALAAEHAARAGLLAPLREAQAVAQGAAAVNAAPPVMPPPLAAALAAEANAEAAEAAAAAELAAAAERAEAERAAREAAAAADVAAARQAAADAQAEAEAAAAAAAARARSGASSGLSGAPSELSAPGGAPQPSPSGSSWAGSARSTPSLPPLPARPLPEELTRPISARTAAALEGWDFAFQRAEDPSLAAKRTVIRLVREVERLQGALQASGQEVADLRGEVAAARAAAAAAAKAADGNARLAAAASGDAEDAILRRVARAVTAERPSGPGGALPRGALGAQLARSELVDAVKILARKLAAAQRAAARPPPSRGSDESELPGATQFAAFAGEGGGGRPPAAPAAGGAGGAGDYAELQRKYVHMRRAHFKQSRFIQSLQTRLSRVELLRATVKTQEAVITKLQRWVEHKLAAQAAVPPSAARSTGSAAAPPPDSGVLQARNMRIAVLEEQLTENARSFAAELSELKMRLLQAEMGALDSGSDSGSDADGGGGGGGGEFTGRDSSYADTFEDGSTAGGSWLGGSVADSQF